MGLLDKFRGKKASPDTPANGDNRNVESVNDTVEKLNDVLNCLGNLNPDQQAYISRLIKATVKELKYGIVFAADVSSGDEMLGGVADQLSKALIRKDSSAISSAVKVIQKAVRVRKEIQSGSLMDSARYEYILKCGQIIMSIHDKLYDTNTALNSLNKDKTYLDTKIKEDENNVRTLVDSNPEAAVFVKKFNPNGSQKLSDCEGAQELADAYDEYKKTKRTITQIYKYNDTARKLQATIDELMRMIDTKNTALTAEEKAKVDALIKEIQHSFDKEKWVCVIYEYVPEEHEDDGFKLTPPRIIEDICLDDHTFERFKSERTKSTLDSMQT